MNTSELQQLKIAHQEKLIALQNSMISNLKWYMDLREQGELADAIPALARQDEAKVKEHKLNIPDPISDPAIDLSGIVVKHREEIGWIADKEDYNRSSIILLNKVRDWLQAHPDLAPAEIHLVLNSNGDGDSYESTMVL